MENEAHGLLSMPGVGFFGMLVIGILAGYIAEKVTASDHGLLTNLLVGIAGAFVGVISSQPIICFPCFTTIAWVRSMKEAYCSGVSVFTSSPPAWK